MKKKILLSLMVLFLTVGLFACEKEEVQEEKDQVELTVWASDLDQDVTQTMLDSFALEYAEEADFTFTLGAVSEANAKDEVLTDIEAAADVFAFADDQLNELYTAGALLEVQENTSNVISRNGGNDAGVIQAATINNKLYAYPMSADNGYFLYYDSSVYSETDVETLDGILAAAEADGSQFTIQINNAWYLYSFFQGAGLTLTYNGELNATDWNSAVGVKVVESIIAMAEHPGYINIDDAGFKTGLANGTISAGVNGTWNAQDAQDAFGDHYAATKLPTFTLDGEQTQMASFAGYKLVGVNATTDEAYWSMMLSDWLTNEANQVLRFNERGIGPSNVNAASSDDVAANPAISALSQQAPYSTVQYIGDAFWSPAETFGNLIVDGTLSSSSLTTAISDALDILADGIEAAPVE